MGAKAEWRGYADTILEEQKAAFESFKSGTFTTFDVSEGGFTTTAPLKEPSQVAEDVIDAMIAGLDVVPVPAAFVGEKGLILSAFSIVEQVPDKPSRICRGIYRISGKYSRARETPIYAPCTGKDEGVFPNVYALFGTTLVRCVSGHSYESWIPPH